MRERKIEEERGTEKVEEWRGGNEGWRVRGRGWKDIEEVEWEMRQKKKREKNAKGEGGILIRTADGRNKESNGGNWEMARDGENDW